jgi:hypothetical protein
MISIMDKVLGWGMVLLAVVTVVAVLKTGILFVG